MLLTSTSHDEQTAFCQKSPGSLSSNLHTSHTLVSIVIAWLVGGPYRLIPVPPSLTLTLSSKQYPTDTLQVPSCQKASISSVRRRDLPRRRLIVSGTLPLLDIAPENVPLLARSVCSPRKSFAEAHETWRIADSLAGSFHSRALAASAAHRYRRPSDQRSKSDHLTPRLQAKTNSHVDLPKLPKTFYSPANSPPSPGSGFLSPKHRTSKGPRSPALSSSYSHSHVPYRSLSTISGSSSQSGDPEYSWLGAGGGTGDEPGVDVKSRRDEEAWGHLTGETKVTVSL